MKLNDLTGKVFGRLSVVSRAENLGKHVLWNCVCECGNRVSSSSTHLSTGHTKSCGCLAAELLEKRNRTAGTHRMWKTVEWNAWHSMKQRCSLVTHKKYALYGGRGIVVCQEWAASFQAFFDHVGTKPVGKYSLDRIDTNKGYVPGNVRWATDAEQNNNRRSNLTVQVDGKVMTAAEAARYLGITDRAVRYRIANGIPLQGGSE